MFITGILTELIYTRKTDEEILFVMQGDSPNGTYSARTETAYQKIDRLIGDILGQVPIGVGDWWYAARIEHFIRQGKIKVVEDSENKYARLIKRYL